MFKKIFISLICLLVLSACRKDKTVKQNDCISPLPNTSSTITVGDTTDMHFNSNIMELIGQYGGTKEFYLPIWCNDTNDVLIELHIIDGPGPAVDVTADISSPNNSFKFKVVENTDTIYWLNDTSYVGTNPVDMNVKLNHKTCTYSSSVDSIFEINDKTDLLSSGDVLSINDTYVTSTTLVRGQSVNPNISVTQINADTTLQLSQNYYYFKCNNLSSANPNYIAFKGNIEGVEKLGWMKIQYLYNQGVRISEIAVQK